MTLKNKLKIAASITGFTLGVGGVLGGIVYSAAWGINYTWKQGRVYDQDNYHIRDGDLGWAINSTGIYADTESNIVGGKAKLKVIKSSILSDSIRYDDIGKTVEDLDGKVDQIIIFKTDGTIKFESRNNDEYKYWPEFKKEKEERFKEADKIFAETKERFKPDLEKIFKKF